MKPRAFALWLDGADAPLLEQLMDAGRLPTLAGMRRRGAYGRLENIDHSYVEATAAMVTTGCHPQQTGAWNMQQFCPGTYELSGAASYDHREFPPFFALGSDFRCAIFDIPFMPIHEDVHGLQLTAWGSNSHDMPMAAQPSELREEVTQKFGRHPARGGNGYAMLEDAASIRSLYERLRAGLRLRERVLLDLFGKERWDLFFTAMTETDAAGHYLFPHRGCDAIFQTCGAGNFLRDLYIEVDAIIGRLAHAFGKDICFVIFSVEGMRPNSDDLASMVFLPELLLRHSFPGRKTLNFDSVHGPSPESQAGIHDWVMEMWNYRTRPGKIARKLRKRWSPAVAVRVERLLGMAPTLFHPLTDNSFFNHQPLRWYRPYWRHMKAFALPTSSHGLVRLNVAGRERHGRVRPDDYERTCTEIARLLMELRLPDSEQTAVAEVQRVRNHPHEGERLQAADLIVKWHPSLGNRLESPTFGRFGPVPFVRTGTHTREGFLLASGPGIAPASTFATGRPVDIATTILTLLRAPVPAHLPGRALIADSLAKKRSAA